jgi:hypothetical protein
MSFSFQYVWVRSFGHGNSNVPVYDFGLWKNSSAARADKRSHRHGRARKAPNNSGEDDFQVLLDRLPWKPERRCQDAHQATVAAF